MAVKNMNLGDSSTTINFTTNGNIVGENIRSKGSAIQPIYFDENGVAQETSYTLNGASSDWAENDEEQGSYIKNRTHWKDKGVVKTTIFTNFGFIYNIDKLQDQ